MTARLPLPMHGALEVVAGLAILVSPFALGFGPAGTIVAVLLGAVLVGLALAATATDGDALPVSAHLASDQTLIVGFGAAAATLALVGDRPASLVLLAGAVVVFLLLLTTRWTTRPGGP